MVNEQNEPIQQPQSVTRQVKRVNFLENDADFQAIVLGALGFSYRAIEQATGLSKGDIYYRLKQHGIRLKDYRDGKSQISQMVVQRSKAMVSKEIVRQLKG